MLQLCKLVFALAPALYLLALEQTKRTGKRLRAGLNQRYWVVFLPGIFKETKVPYTMKEMAKVKYSSSL